MEHSLLTTLGPQLCYKLLQTTTNYKAEHPPGRKGATNYKPSPENAHCVLFYYTILLSLAVNSWRIYYKLQRRGALAGGKNYILQPIGGICSNA